MTTEKWLIQPGSSRVIDLDGIRSLKVGLVGGQVDIVAHDEPGVRIEVHGVTGKDLRIEATDDFVEIDHPQLRWDNFLEVFRNFGNTGPRAEISIAVPRQIALNLGVVSASALVTGIRSGAKLNTVSGDIIVDEAEGELVVNAVSGDVQARALSGTLNANSVSGDVAVQGTVRKTSIDTVSGNMMVDNAGDAHQINLNTVSGSSTVRLDRELAANYAMRSISGRVLVDGVIRSGQGNGPTTSFSGSTGELSGSFVDVRVNSVSGNITVLRRTDASQKDASASVADGSL
jgi:hypothetical protein